MRFLSKTGKFIVSVRPQINEAYAAGFTKTIQMPLYAVFSVDGVTLDERALARAHFSFNGFYQEQDLVTIVEPDYRISVFDSVLAAQANGWSPEERELVETELVRKCRQMPEELLLVEEERIAPPWPTYDSFTGTRAKLLEKIAEDGYDLVEVLAYERQAQNRDDVVAALERAMEDEPDTSPVMEEELVG